MDALRLILILTMTAFCASDAPAQAWTITSAPSNFWSCASSSADGKTLAVAPGGSGGGAIIISTNYGQTWTQTTVSANWSSLAASADCRVLAAAARGPVYLSTNSGSTWNLSVSAPSGVFGVAVSADGRTLLASVNFGSIYLSTNSGSSWRNVGPSTQDWAYATMSADATTLAVGVSPSTHPFIATSTNAGATWTSNSLPFYCAGVAASADGKKLVTAVLGFGIYVSTNSGASWATSTAPNASWRGVASSADGTRLAAIYNNGSSAKIYTSSDGGGTWSTNDVTDQDWNGVAESADGNEVIAVAGYNYKGPIYTSRTTPRPKLGLTVASPNVKLSWLVPSTNFVLLGSSNLEDWNFVTNAPLLDATNLQQEVTVPFSQDNSFFRLATP